MSKNSLFLQDLVKAYYNDGIECYQEYQMKLQSSGVILHFPKPQLNLFGGVGSLLELLSEHNLLITPEKDLNRRRISRPHLYLSSQYSLVVLDNLGEEISSTVNFCFQEKEIPNIPVSKSFIEKFQKSEKLSLKIKLVKKGFSQTVDETEAKRFLGAQHHAEYLSLRIFEIISKPHQYNSDLILERVQLFKVFPKTILEMQEMIKAKQLVPSTFGIGDTLILENIFSKFKIPTLRNEDLLKYTESQEETAVEIAKFLRHLRENETPEFSLKKTR